MGLTTPQQAILAKLIPLIQKGALQGMQAGAGMMPRPNPNPTMSPARTPGQPQQQPSAGGGGPSIKQDPMASVGTMGAPTPQPIFDVQSLEQLLAGWKSRKEARQQAEASNAAQALMQAIDSAKTTGDWTDAYTILSHNEKLFNKVYKGWLQKSEQAQKQQQQKQKPEKPDPETQGFEQGVQTHLSKKQQQQQAQAKQWQGPPAQGSAARRLGPYILPGASPTQALAQQDVSAQRQYQAQGGLPPGVAKTEAELEKLRTEQQKSQTELIKSAREVQKAQYESDKAEAELKLKLAELSAAKDKSTVSLDIEKQKYLTAQANRDKARWQLEKARLGAQTAQQPKLTQATKIKIEAAERAKILIDGLTGKDTLEASDIQALQNELKTAGATSLANSIRPGGLWSWVKSKPGQTSDVKSLQSAFSVYYEGLKSATTPATTKPAGKSEVDEEEDDTTEEGDLPPGWSSPAPTPKKP